MIVQVLLKAALICFSGQCYPALVGASTPTGVFPLQQREVLSPGYGGDVLQFKVSKDGENIWSVHRLWLGIPSQHRRARLASGDHKDRMITAGCINVDPKVYAELVDLHPSTLEIIP